MSRPSTWQSLLAAARNRRIGAVTLLSFSSGLPLGLVFIAIPPWLKREGFDITQIGLLTLAQAPWTFKFVWAPLMDRFHLPFLGRKRGWIVATQLGLIGATGLLAWQAANPAFWVIFALATGIAFLGASQDIVYDGYAVEVLEQDELELAAGGRIALYRVAMFISGSLAITLAGTPIFGWKLGWPLVLAVVALLYVPLLVITLAAPEPRVPAPAPAALGEAVWQPLVGFFRQTRALEIVSFIFLYKIADNLAGALVRPFLVDVGFNDLDVGVATGTVGLIAALVGAAIGALVSDRIGLGKALWIFGALQAISNLGYVAIVYAGVNRPLMYGAMFLETSTQNMGSAAFMVLLLRLTDKRFSATQFALLTSVMALGRTVTGPPAGLLVSWMGWSPFFLLTIPLAIPGLWVLHRFVPFGNWEPVIHVESETTREPFTPAALWGRGLAGGAVGLLLGWVTAAALAGLRGLRADPPQAFDLVARLVELALPASPRAALRLAGPLIFGLVCGAATAALAAARGRRR